MREIRFRAWDKELVVMRSWEYLRENNFNYNREWYRDNTGEDKPNDIWSDDDLTPEQFTGLKDRHGREIYEGDIVVYRRNRSIYRPLPYDSYSEVCFGEYAFGEYENACHGYGWYLRDITDSPDGACIGPDTSDLYEVAGNIHENPEMLQ